MVAFTNAGGGVNPGQVWKPASSRTTAPVAPHLRPEMTGFVDWMKGQRDGDLAAGKQLASGYFGAGNPMIAEILKTRRERALCLNEGEMNLMRQRAGSEINRQTQTNLRQLRSGQQASGVRGGAAIGQALPILQQASDARAKAETDIALADMQRRSAELNALESTVTGERAGELGTMFGVAGLGSADRSSAIQHVLGQDFLKYALDNLATTKGASVPSTKVGGDSKPWWDGQRWVDVLLPQAGGQVDRATGGLMGKLNPRLDGLLNPAEATRRDEIEKLFSGVRL